MELREAIFNRHSIRRYRAQDVEREKLLKILEDANQAPSAGNLQARDFIIVTDPGAKEEIARASLDQRFIAEAPVVIVVCANMARSAAKYGRRGAGLYSILDAALAAENLMLSCTEEGLGTCYVGAFDEERVGRLLGIPETAIPIGIIPVGYPDEEPLATPRLPIEEIVHWNGW
ncbi:MAG: nitroreductase family protein [Methanobacteriota archaeon]|nr:MAG: nitroreductase family protein [Euryarchaeota archaeon]